MQLLPPWLTLADRDVEVRPAAKATNALTWFVLQSMSLVANQLVICDQAGDSVSLSQSLVAFGRISISCSARHRKLESVLNRGQRNLPRADLVWPKQLAIQANLGSWTIEPAREAFRREAQAVGIEKE